MMLVTFVDSDSLHSNLKTWLMPLSLHWMAKRSRDAESEFETPTHQEMSSQRVHLDLKVQDSTSAIYRSKRLKTICLHSSKTTVTQFMFSGQLTDLAARKHSLSLQFNLNQRVKKLLANSTELTSWAAISRSMSPNLRTVTREEAPVANLVASPLVNCVLLLKRKKTPRRKSADLERNEVGK